MLDHFDEYCSLEYYFNYAKYLVKYLNTLPNTKKLFKISRNLQFLGCLRKDHKIPHALFSETEYFVDELTNEQFRMHIWNGYYEHEKTLVSFSLV
jgi:hypothetical protein